MLGCDDGAEDEEAEDLTVRGMDKIVKVGGRRRRHSNLRASMHDEQFSNLLPEESQLSVCPSPEHFGIHLLISLGLWDDEGETMNVTNACRRWFARSRIFCARDCEYPGAVQLEHVKPCTPGAILQRMR